MQYKDEEILKQRKAAAMQQMGELENEEKEREQQESILDGMVHIDDKEVAFERREIPKIGIALQMPVSFEFLEGEMKEAIYPFGNPPTNVYADLTIPFQITLNKTTHTVPEEGIPAFMKMTAKLLENNGPKVRILSNGVVKIHEHDVGIMEVASRAVDCNVYNVMFYLVIENTLVIGSINFATKYSKRMMPIAKEILDSIEQLNDLEEKEASSDGNNHLS